ncbi:2-C-methyl-D-erythritol 4-phosphate cytidylyltransferase [Thermobrachium celere]|uniref:2-C-methyl-D-erythritol 4-phosphate cytidylyltransferase n=1 Tax=Thermobrachium celere DSM 8682 TaxID=941824 RepID=R7RS86_9CLOT|nr:2-C-methyl-D-erythritol 4-phosphate cytidylyltransferase [Thermobrachium celere]CDF58924.1 2-C-methyl-D-erythritol 4-phosphate cytidylyltransferase [Thermobrachium celere DSM 8682]
MVTALIVAAGKGKRMGLGYNKQYLLLDGKEVIARTLDVFDGLDFIDNIVVVVAEDEVDYFKKNIIEKYGYKKVTKIVKGGSERQDSVYNGLVNCCNSDIVLIHDGARPFVKREHILKSIEMAKKYGASAVAVKVKDTVKYVQGEFFEKTLDRNFIYLIQTPQTFKYELIIKAHEFAKENGVIATDDTSLLECLGYKVRVVEGSYDNIKITTPEDIQLAQLILKK